MSQSLEKPITLESLGEVPDYFEPQSCRYLVRNSAGRWLPLKESSYKRLLRSRGLKSKAEEGAVMSEVDLAILDVQSHRDIAYFGPICGRNSGLLEANGQRILVTEDLRLHVPAPGHWENLRRTIEGLLQQSESSDIGRIQVLTFHAWIKSSIEALMESKLQQQQALAICGEPGSGKSFLQTVITCILGGRSAKAERYFSGKTPFNAELFGSEHLILEDEHCSTRTEHRVRLGAMIKQHTVSTGVSSLHAKGCNAVNIPAWWRVTITLNSDPEAMMVLPPLDQHIADKIILLRASRFQWPMPMGTTNERDRCLKIVESEIPAYLYWLLHEWDIPPEIADPSRYNVATFHHPELAEALHSFSPEAELRELLFVVYGKTPDSSQEIRATAAEIEAAIRRREKGRAERLFTFRNACGTYLGRLAKKQPDLLMGVRDEMSRSWIIRPEFFRSALGGKSRLSE